MFFRARPRHPGITEADYIVDQEVSPFRSSNNVRAIDRIARENHPAVPVLDLVANGRVSVAMDIIVAGIIVAGLPGSALWAIGLLVGINLLFGGASLIAMALAARDN